MSRSRTATPGYRSTTSSHRARSRACKRSCTPQSSVEGGRHSVAHPILPTRCYTPDGVAKNELNAESSHGEVSKKKAGSYSIAPWIRALQTISPLTNSAKTKQHFPEDYCRYGSEEWRTRPKRRMGSIPLQSHDRSAISDSHLLRTFKDDRNDQGNQRAATAAAGMVTGRNRRERHWGLVPQLPNVGWSDSNLTRKMADFHIGKEAKDHGRNVFARSGAIPIGRNTFPTDHMTESVQPQNMKPEDNKRASTGFVRPEPAGQPRELWSRGSDISLHTELGMPAKSQLRPQDAVFAGRAALGRECADKVKNRFRSPFATSVAPANDFEETTEWHESGIEHID